MANEDFVVKFGSNAKTFKKELQADITEVNGLVQELRKALMRGTNLTVDAKGVLRADPKTQTTPTTPQERSFSREIERVTSSMEKHESVLGDVTRKMAEAAAQIGVVAGAIKTSRTGKNRSDAAKEREERDPGNSNLSNVRKAAKAAAAAAAAGALDGVEEEAKKSKRGKGGSGDSGGKSVRDVTKVEIDAAVLNRIVSQTKKTAENTAITNSKLDQLIAKANTQVVYQHVEAQRTGTVAPGAKPPSGTPAPASGPAVTRNVDDDAFARAAQLRRQIQKRERETALNRELARLSSGQGEAPSGDALKSLAAGSSRFLKTFREEGGTGEKYKSRVQKALESTRSELAEVPKLRQLRAELDAAIKATGTEDGRRSREQMQEYNAAKKAAPAAGAPAATTEQGKAAAKAPKSERLPESAEARLKRVEAKVTEAKAVVDGYATVIAGYEMAIQQVKSGELKNNSGADLEGLLATNKAKLAEAQRNLAKAERALIPKAERRAANKQAAAAQREKDNPGGRTSREALDRLEFLDRAGSRDVLEQMPVRELRRLASTFREEGYDPKIPRSANKTQMTQLLNEVHQQFSAAGRATAGNLVERSGRTAPTVISPEAKQAIGNLLSRIQADVRNTANDAIITEAYEGGYSGQRKGSRRGADTAYPVRNNRETIDEIEGDLDARRKRLAKDATREGRARILADPKFDPFDPRIKAEGKGAEARDARLAIRSIQEVVGRLDKLGEAALRAHDDLERMDRRIHSLDSLEGKATALGNKNRLTPQESSQYVDILASIRKLRPKVEDDALRRPQVQSSLEDFYRQAQQKRLTRPDGTRIQGLGMAIPEGFFGSPEFREGYAKRKGSQDARLTARLNADAARAEQIQQASFFGADVTASTREALFGRQNTIGVAAGKQRVGQGVRAVATQNTALFPDIYNEKIFGQQYKDYDPDALKKARKATGSYEKAIKDARKLEQENREDIAAGAAPRHSDEKIAAQALKIREKFSLLMDQIERAMTKGFDPVKERANAAAEGRAPRQAIPSVFDKEGLRSYTPSIADAAIERDRVANTKARARYNAEEKKRRESAATAADYLRNPLAEGENLVKKVRGNKDVKGLVEREQANAVTTANKAGLEGERGPRPLPEGVLQADVEKAKQTITTGLKRYLDVISRYSAENLQKMSVGDLRALAKQRRVTPVSTTGYVPNSPEVIAGAQAKRDAAEKQRRAAFSDAALARDALQNGRLTDEANAPRQKKHAQALEVLAKAEQAAAAAEQELADATRGKARQRRATKNDLVRALTGPAAVEEDVLADFQTKTKGAIGRASALLQRVAQASGNPEMLAAVDRLTAARQKLKNAENAVDIAKGGGAGADRFDELEAAVRDAKFGVRDARAGVTRATGAVGGNDAEVATDRRAAIEIAKAREELAKAGVRWSATLNASLNEAKTLEDLQKRLQAMIQNDTLMISAQPSERARNAPPVLGTYSQVFGENRPKAGPNTGSGNAGAFARAEKILAGGEVTRDIGLVKGRLAKAAGLVYSEIKAEYDGLEGLRRLLDRAKAGPGGKPVSGPAAEVAGAKGAIKDAVKAGKSSGFSDDCCTRIVEAIHGVTAQLKSGLRVVGLRGGAENETTVQTRGPRVAGQPRRGTAAVSPEDRAAAAEQIRTEHAQRATRRQRRIDRGADQEATAAASATLKEEAAAKELERTLGRLSLRTHEYIEQLRQLVRAGAPASQILAAQQKVYGAAAVDLVQHNPRAGQGRRAQQIGGVLSDAVGAQLPHADVRRLGVEAEETIASTLRQQATAHQGQQGPLVEALFGGKGFMSRVLNSTGTFLVRNFTAGFVFGITNALGDAASQAIETESTFIRVSAALESTGRSSAGLRTDLSRISTDYGVALKDVYTTAAGLTGVFNNNDLLLQTTEVATQLQLISGGALNATEAMKALSGITSAYAEATPQHIADVATVIQTALSVNIEETIEGVARLSGLTAELDINFENAAGYVAAVSKFTNQTGAGAGEQLSRILATMQTGRAQGAIISALNQSQGTDSDNPAEAKRATTVAAAQIEQQFATRDLQGAMDTLLESYGSLDKAEQSRISVAIGGQRQAAAINGLLGEGAKVLDTITRAQNSHGAAEERSKEISEELRAQLDRTRQAFVNLIGALARSGAFNILGVALVVVRESLEFVVNKINQFNDLLDTNALTRWGRTIVTTMAGAAVAVKLLTLSLGAMYTALGANRIAALAAGTATTGAAVAGTTAAVAGTAAAGTAGVATLGVAGGTAAATAAQQRAVGRQMARSSLSAIPMAIVNRRAWVRDAARYTPMAPLAPRNFGRGVVIQQGNVVSSTGQGRFFAARSTNMDDRAARWRSTQVAAQERAAATRAAAVAATGSSGRLVGSAASAGALAAGGMARGSSMLAGTFAKIAAAGPLMSMAFMGVAAAAGLLTYEFFKTRKEASKQKELYDKVFGNKDKRQDDPTVGNAGNLFAEAADQNVEKRTSKGDFMSYAVNFWKRNLTGGVFGQTDEERLGILDDETDTGIRNMLKGPTEALKAARGDAIDIKSALEEGREKLNAEAKRIQDSDEYSPDQKNTALALIQDELNRMSDLAASMTLDAASSQMGKLTALTLDQIQGIGGLVQSILSFSPAMQKQFAPLLRNMVNSYGFKDDTEIQNLLDSLVPQDFQPRVRRPKPDAAPTLSDNTATALGQLASNAGALGPLQYPTREANLDYLRAPGAQFGVGGRNAGVFGLQGVSQPNARDIQGESDLARNLRLAQERNNAQPEPVPVVASPTEPLVVEVATAPFTTGTAQRSSGTFGVAGGGGAFGVTGGTLAQDTPGPRVPEPAGFEARLAEMRRVAAEARAEVESTLYDTKDPSLGLRTPQVAESRRLRAEDLERQADLFENRVLGSTEERRGQSRDAAGRPAPQVQADTLSQALEQAIVRGTRQSTDVAAGLNIPRTGRITGVEERRAGNAEAYARSIPADARRNLGNRANLEGEPDLYPSKYLPISQAEAARNAVTPVTTTADRRKVGVKILESALMSAQTQVDLFADQNSEAAVQARQAAITLSGQLSQAINEDFQATITDAQALAESRAMTGDYGGAQDALRGAIDAIKAKRDELDPSDIKGRAAYDRMIREQQKAITGQGLTEGLLQNQADIRGTRNRTTILDEQIQIATDDLNAAKAEGSGYNPQEISQKQDTLQNLINQRRDQFDQQMAAADATTLANIAPLDVAALANQRVINAQAAQDRARKYGESSTEYQQATQTLIAAMREADAADVDLVKAQTELAIAVAEAAGSAVKSAKLAAGQAQTDYETALALAGGNTEAPAVIRADAARVRANANKRDAITQKRIAIFEADNDLQTALAEVAGRDVKVARLAVAAAENAYQEALKKANGDASNPDVIKADAARVRAAGAERDAVLNDRLATIDFNLEMGNITANSAIASLQEILKQTNLTEQQRRDIMLKIKGLQGDIRDSLTGSGFNIPDAIKLPTAYEVRRSLGVDKYTKAGNDTIRAMAGMRSEMDARLTASTQADARSTNTVQDMRSRGLNPVAPSAAAAGATAPTSSAVSNIVVNNTVSSPAMVEAVARRVVELIQTGTGARMKANTVSPSLVRI